MPSTNTVLKNPLLTALLRCAAPEVVLVVAKYPAPPLGVVGVPVKNHFSAIAGVELVPIVLQVIDNTMGSFAPFAVASGLTSKGLHQLPTPCPRYRTNALPALTDCMISLALLPASLDKVSIVLYPACSIKLLACLISLQ
ncbi:hypothetical protein ES703_117699 [subsurface metagenome]